MFTTQTSGADSFTGQIAESRSLGTAATMKPKPMKGVKRKRDPRWRCWRPKKHPADCFCRLEVNQPYAKTRRVIE